MIRNHAGLFIAILLSALVVVLFYGQPLKNANSTFFAVDGDGLKDYMNTVYFVKYDKEWFHSSSMNYPHGEHIFFTGNQPSISFVLRFINRNIVDISNYITGILNIIMLLSFVVGTFFLYLLLRHFGLPQWYSVLVSIGVTFLTPQIGRFAGHFSLSYVFAIPAMLYLVARFRQKPRYWMSLIIGLFVLWALGTHIYMLGFHAFIILLSWFSVFAFTKRAFRQKENYYHLGLQFIVPLFVFTLVTILTDNVADRTSYPWGFLYYRAFPESVFLPVGKPYGLFLNKLSSFSYIDWEGFAYAGLVVLLGLIITVISFINKIVWGNFSSLFQLSDNNTLNLFFWISILALLYSFGLPFIICGAELLIHFIGPLKQMRGIARFSWLFFYGINIFVFYKIWMLREKGIHKVVWVVVLAGSVSILLYDAWYNLKVWAPFVRNSYPALADHQNKLEENSWVRTLNTNEFQATIPIPYFHVGSENIWVEPKCGILRETLFITWKTGLPGMGVMMSRTSISQTFENLQLFTGPYRKPVVLDKLDREKDFLLITRADCSEITEFEQRIIEKSTPFHHSVTFNLYRLTWDSLAVLHANPYPKVRAEIESGELFDHDGYLSSNPEVNFVADRFDGKETDNYYFVPGTFRSRFRGGEFRYNKDIPVTEPNQEFIISIWIYGITRDLMLRSNLQLEVRDQNDQGHQDHSVQLFRAAKIFDGNWALIEQRFVLRDSTDMIRWRILNNDILRGQYKVGHTLIRPFNADIYLKGDGWVMKNNRFYLAIDQ